MLALGHGAPAVAGQGTWTVRLVPMYVEAYGHDQHVLNVHRIDLDASPRQADTTGVSLETDAGPAYRLELEYTRGGKWGLGLDFFWFTTPQNAELTAAAGGAIDQVRFEIADRTYTSSGPGEVLYYSRLEDTDLAVWTADLYGIRTLAEQPASGLRLHLGLRVGDFDNDYRAAVGVEGVAGSRLDASSNYDRMMGPLVGLAGDLRRGRNHIEAYLGQSVIVGSVRLTSSSRQFTGPFGEMPAFVDAEVFRTDQDVAIPITDLRIQWTHKLSNHVALGLGTSASAWWDVPVPPGVVPAEDDLATLHENTIVFVGALASVQLTF